MPSLTSIMAGAIGILMVALAGLGWYAKEATETAATERAGAVVARDAAKNSAEQVDVLQKAMIEREAVMADNQRKATERTKTLEKRIAEIDHAPTSDDGPVAPVLARTLDRLRTDGDGDGKGSGNGDGSGTASGKDQKAGSR